MSSNTTGQVIGYARVSAADQNLARQLDALGHVDKLFSEKLSGKNRERPQLHEMIDYARAGDKVLVKSPDRLARSSIDLLEIVRELKDKGVELEFIDFPALNTTDKMGSFMLQILSAVAELERATIRERQAEGIALAKERGAYDRGPKLNEEQIAEARERIDLGVPKAVVARDLGVSRSTLYAALAGTGRYEQPSSS
ncbi:recombinase family protein [Nesterenkonia sp. YGD6]|uniref:recombinase family protein n=1 Tax=Nesterenkonia sp. YGD6 TaxID=2901231 RepID=UPI001F4D11A7|nr:recombinase family protein [Nesterenkonia sp. YGD6]MCH8562039.1 recombinase family protein [Nesterenkonia sp. YGD6]